MSTERQGTAALREVVVVCPTEYGGQLEHAADLALALEATPGVAAVTLVSRPGARAYLGWAAQHPVRIVETVPPRRVAVPRHAVGRLLRSGLQVLDLVREHAAVRAVARGAGEDAVLALDSTKYPLPRLLCGRASQRTAVFVHNAQPHFDVHGASVREKVLLWLDRACARRADRVITHGVEQAEIIRGYTTRPVTAVQLPVSSRLDPDSPAPLPAQHHGRYALCIGEVRANKGIEHAVVAAGEAGVPLLVRGAAESPALGEELTRLAARYPGVDFQDRFLTREEFAGYVRDAAVIVLPYTHFDAHSGVLAKAVGAGTPVVASDLASLREQAGDYPRFTAADIHDPAAFGSALRTAFDDAATRAPGVGTPSDAAPAPVGEDHGDWEPSVAAVLGTQVA